MSLHLELLFYVSSLFLNPETFGTYNYLLTLVGFFATFGEFGLSAAVNRYIAEYRVKDPKKVQTVISSAIYIFFSLSLIVLVFLIIFNVFLFNFDLIYFIYLIFLLFLISASNIFDGIYLGLKKFKTSSLITLLSGAIVLPMSFFMINVFKISGALLVQVIYYAIIALLLFRFSKLSKLQFSKEFVFKVFKYAIIIGFAGLAYFLYTNIDILILQQFGYTVEIGYYKIIFNVFNIIILPFALLGQVVSPYVTEIGANKDYKKLNLYLRYLWMIGVIAILIALVCLIGGPLFFHILFPSYANEVLFSIWNIMLILIPFKLYGAVLTHGLLYPLGLGHVTMYLTVAGGVLNVIFDYILIITIGFLGIFYSTIVIHSMTIILTLIIFFYKIKKRKIKV